MDKTSFTETLHEVRRIMETSAEPLTREAVMGYFSEVDLSEDQKNMIYDYLLKPEEEPKGVDESDDVIVAPGESKSLKFYMDEIADIATDSSEALMVELRCGNEGVIAELVKIFLPQIAVVADKHVHDKVAKEDLIQEGNLAAFISLKQLCGNDKITSDKVRESVLAAAEQAMSLYATNEMGEEDSEQAILGKVSLVGEAIKLLTEQNGSEPTDEEVAKFTNMDVEEIVAVKDFLSRK